MIVHEVFAMVFGGEIQNVMICQNYPEANYLARCIYGEEAIAVDCSQYPVGVGDKYHDNFFWKVDSETGEEVEVLPKPTQEQQVSELKSENKELVTAMAELIGG